MAGQGSTAMPDRWSPGCKRGSVDRSASRVVSHAGDPVGISRDPAAYAVDDFEVRRNRV